MLSSIFKRLIKDITILSSFVAVGKFLGLVLIPIQAKFLSLSEFGILAMLNLIVVGCEPFMKMGISNGVFRYFDIYRKDGQDRALLGNAFFCVSFFSGSFLILFLIFSSKISEGLTGTPEYSSLVKVGLFTALIHAHNEIPKSFFRASNELKTLSYFNLFQTVSLVASACVLSPLHKSPLAAFMIAALFSEMVFALLGYWAIRNQIILNLNREILKKLTQYSVPFFFQQIEGAGLVPITQYFIRTSFGLEAVGVFNLARRITIPIIMACKIFQDAWSPLKFHLHQSNERAHIYFGELFVYSFAAMCFFWVVVCAWGPEVIQILTPTSFHDAADLLPIVSLIPLSQGVFMMMATGTELGNNTRPIAFANLIGLICVIVSTYLLKNYFGLMGVTLSPVLAWVVMAAVIYFFSQKYFKIIHAWKKLAVTLLTAGAFCLSENYFSSSVGSFAYRLQAILTTVLFPLIIMKLFGIENLRRWPDPISRHKSGDR